MKWILMFVCMLLINLLFIVLLLFFLLTLSIFPFLFSPPLFLLIIFYFYLFCVCVCLGRKLVCCILIIWVGKLVYDIIVFIWSNFEYVELILEFGGGEISRIWPMRDYGFAESWIIELYKWCIVLKRVVKCVYVRCCVNIICCLV